MIWMKEGKNMHEAVKKLMQGVIVSCQAYEDTPLYGAENMKRMAQCAIMGGAKGIRSCWPQDIKAIRAITDLPIIGIYKKVNVENPEDEVMITPDFESASKVIESGADILAIDCTIRPSRNFESLVTLLREIKYHYPDVALMADIATLQEGVRVAETGLVDIISTTLSGYTRQTLSKQDLGPDIQLIIDLKKQINLPVNGEGRVWELQDLQAMLDAGTDMVTVGTVVTRPHLITERFVNFNEAFRKNQ